MPNPEQRSGDLDRYHFNPISQDVLRSGRHEMDKFGHRSFSTGYLLLGLMQNGLAKEVLSKHKLDLDSVRAAVKELQIDDESLPAGVVFLTPKVKTVISQAIREQKADRAEQLSSLHLLRGFMSIEMQFRSLLKGEPLSYMTISKKLGLDPGVIFDQAKKLSFDEADGSPIDEDLHFAVLVFLNPAPEIKPQQEF